ncbi:S-layer domain protein [Calothrix sp. PCC 7716]|nr:S-layer domain protein [Calothrix sp. PCC 7716]
MLNYTAATNIYQKPITRTIALGISLLLYLLLAKYPAKAETEISEAPFRDQITSVDELSDVQPSDWAFKALQSLIERYGCIAGYNSNFRGNRAITRYEFAAGLNTCLNNINQLISSVTDGSVKTEELTTLKKLQQEFSTELSILQERVNTLQAHTASLESQQFSTTTKLQGQVIMSVNAGGFDGKQIIDSNGRELADTNPNPTVIYRAGVDLNTSFHGTDLLKIRVETGSGGALDNAAGVLEPNFGSSLDYSVKPPVDRDMVIGRLYYTFKPNSDFIVSIGPDIRTTDYLDRNSYANRSFLDFSTQPFVNNFILFPVSGPASGGAVDWKPGQGAFALRAVYAVADAANPSNTGRITGASSFARLLYPNSPGGDRGLFGDSYQRSVEIEYAPTKNFALRLQYSSGEVFNNRFDVIGANFELTLGTQFGIFGRYGYSRFDNTVFGDIEPNYWMAGVSLRDLFQEGAIFGVAVGQPFIDSNIGDATQTSLEAFYNYPLSQNIRITPSVQVITNAGNQDSNGDIVTSTLRTVFSF